MVIMSLLNKYGFLPEGPECMNSKKVLAILGTEPRPAFLI